MVVLVEVVVVGGGGAMEARQYVQQHPITDIGHRSLIREYCRLAGIPLLMLHTRPKS